MRIFVPPVEIGDKEGFSSEKDIFDRKKLGEGLKSLVSTVADPLGCVDKVSDPQSNGCEKNEAEIA